MRITPIALANWGSDLITLKLRRGINFGDRDRWVDRPDTSDEVIVSVVTSIDALTRL